MLEKIKQLNKDYSDAYWDIKEHEDSIPAEEREKMRSELAKHYAREVALLDGTLGLAQEQEIANIEIARAEATEKTKLKKDEIIEEYRLKHVKLTQQTELEKVKIEEKRVTDEAKLKREFEIQRLAEAEILNIKANEIIPDDKAKRKRHLLFFHKDVPNYAWILANEKADCEARAYLSEREEEVIRMQADLEGSDKIELAIRQVFVNYLRENRRGCKKIIRAFRDITIPLRELLARQVQSDEGTSEEESSEHAESASQKDVTVDNTEQCVIGELPQPEQVQRPKRKRKKRSADDGETIE